MSLNGRALSYSFLANLLLSISFLIFLNNLKLKHYPIIDLSLAEEVYFKVETSVNSDPTKELSSRVGETSGNMKANFKKRLLNPSQGVVAEEGKRGEERNFWGGESPVGEKEVLETVQSHSIQQAKVIDDISAKDGEGLVGKVVKGEPAGYSMSPGSKVDSNRGEELRVAKFQSYQKYYEERNWRIVRDLVERHLLYPPQAVMMGWVGRVVVRLCIESSKLCGQEIVESSGFKILDEAVLVAVKKTDGKLPFSEQRVILLLPIKFELQGVR